MPSEHGQLAAHGRLLGENQLFCPRPSTEVTIQVGEPPRSLRTRRGVSLRYARDLAVPFTNNQAERDLRPAKTQLKISGCHRSASRARAWLRVRGYTSTARKHGTNALTALRDAITGNPWKPNIPATT